jgi:tetratricopeptide (TPR) repeat protein
MKIAVLVLISQSLLPVAYAQQHEHEPKPSGQASLIPGVGKVSHRVSTSKPEAQRFFDQGLALSYAFNHEEASRSFQRAADIDPNLAMAYWGIALVSGPNYNMDVDPLREKLAYEAVQKALSLVGGASEPERDYINALARRYSIEPGADLKKLSLDYKNAMAAVVQKYPDDLDAATLYAESMMNLRPWQLWHADGTPAEGTLEIIRVLQSVLKRDPNHTGANHFLIHAVEASPHPEEALESARRLAGLAPAAGHLVHMPAHIYIRVGDYEGAAQSNRDAAAVDEAYIKTGIQGVYPMMYYSHNLHFLAVAAGMQGRFAEALSAAKDLEANVGPHLKEMPMLDSFMCTSTLIRVWFGRWDTVLSLPEPDKVAAPMTNAIWHFARGMAFAAGSDSQKAESELAAVRQAQQSIPIESVWGNNRGRHVLKVAETILASKVAVAKGDRKSAIDILKHSASLEDALIYSEPPDWYLHPRLLLGGLLISTGDYAGAESVFRADLERHPQSGRALFGLFRSLKAQGKESEANEVYKQYQAAWKKSDTMLRVEDL